MSTQAVALLMILIAMVLFLLAHVLAFLYDWVVPQKLKNGPLKKFDDWWESLAWNSGQW
jgi:hypothetical protein